MLKLIWFDKFLDFSSYIAWMTNRSSRPEVFCKKAVLRISQNSQQNRAKAYDFIKKETLAQVFSCEFFEISKNNFFNRTPLVAASRLRWKYWNHLPGYTVNNLKVLVRYNAPKLYIISNPVNFSPLSPAHSNHRSTWNHKVDHFLIQFCKHRLVRSSHAWNKTLSNKTSQNKFFVKKCCFSKKLW